MRGKGKKPKISCPERSAFLTQRWLARKRRGIEFHFTYEEWIKWWEINLGLDWFEKRGVRSEQYVMARRGDKGPYAPWNVKCITMAENANEALRGKSHGNAKLTKSQVTVVYLEIKNDPHCSITQLARGLDVTDSTIRNIKDKLTWRHVTDLLD